ncbi:MAG: hypothetical protein A2V91_06980 [Candidatus Muproteobacteria bacterium RBG_16_64_10]|uniref:Uncharacterized protein n=1 Tax=Candidatus Muproteobacteria bacterium RBG_16_64_10 TaxID=1817757 RepID=A0A1F6SWB7_9PROT|nr:MAG: hypothetical protein A2V91_06980 [Candidatus Muproteobacteria bacterium RBG_16_64_10]
MPRFLFAFLLFIPPAFAAPNLPEAPAPKAPVDRGSPATAPKPSAAKASPAAAAGMTMTVSAEQWARPRSAATIARLPELPGFIAAFDREPGARVIVRYAGGDEGSLWAEELRSWLVALGIPSAHIELRPDLPQADKLLLELRRQPPR